ncbi:hypothetical protein UFOVP328_188 [uncultured Caudovirales phage]|uniref:Uncharacterized protein n=1 Tax=uncultured Caudovirales phage TaxID=2100421 RepID=A0A6J5LU55_9CAUD|nr:hypothetical protein UFOVP328_188 [uncultured Caudovirales phage]
MKIIKLDRRYRWYPEFEHAIYFPMREWKTYERVVEWFYQQYGVAEYWKSTETGPRYTPNPMWRFDKKKRRIYLKNQADISMALLMS